MSAETIRLIPAQNESHDAWIAAPSTDEAIKSERFARGLQDVLGMDHTPEVEGMDMLSVTDDRVLSVLEAIYPDDSEEVTVLRGFAGVKIETGGDKTVDAKAAKDIAALLAREYEDDTKRVLRNYVSPDTDEIELTGPGYNLAEAITEEHQAVDLDVVLAEQRAAALAEAEAAQAEAPTGSSGRVEEWKVALGGLFDRLHLPRHAH
jgi:hypothetical protein